MEPANRPITLAIHWPRFGPYHLARLQASCAALQKTGIQVVGLEIASQDRLYLWREEVSSDLMRHVVFPGRTYEEISRAEMWSGILATLNKVQPHVTAVNGYSSPDSWAILAWSRVCRRSTILMTESKVDDAPRVCWKEWLKRGLVRQFDAALCGGRPHRSYLERLGMKPGQIFEGYDAIDNDYFWEGAERARQNPTEYRSLPGMESPAPFFLASARFVKRKNLDGLLRAYARYRCQVTKADSTCQPWRLVILGDGIERDALTQLVHSEGLAGVSFPGFRQIDKLPAYYGLAGVFIHPAHQEQWGLVVNEAMAAGLPVLVSNHCGCAPDLVSQGENGFTFDPEDVASLADLMVRVSSGQVDLLAMGQASRARIQRWSSNRFAQGLYGALQVALYGQANYRQTSRNSQN
jgi:1,2-diacylglycerol 3-alpha-glucosyltransferase